MRFAIFSNIHSNLEALEAVLEEIEKCQIDEIFCLGNIVGYGPQPHECIQKIREVGCVSLKGFYDLEVCGEVEKDYEGADYAREAFLHQKKMTTSRRYRAIKISLFGEKNKIFYNGQWYFALSRKI